MKLKIAGGCGEHGRNCFYVEAENVTFLVDCGVMAGEEGGGYPHLTSEEIRNIDYVFLTHSHADHTAAIPWIVERGFNGKVIATEHTLEQLPFVVENTCALESFCVDKQGDLDELHVAYGRSGHCLGSVWYEFQIGEKMLFFSGDYTEDTFVHALDSIRSRYADFAVLDCAYGYDETSFAVYCDKLLQEIGMLKKKYAAILMPVPKYGRGLELYQLLKERFPDFVYAGDAHFVKQCELAAQKNLWFKKLLPVDGLEVYEEGTKADIVFVSDPQLRKLPAQKIANQVLEQGYAVMTGTVEAGTMSDRLIREGKMSVLRFPVHLNYAQYQQLVEKNRFQKVIPYHSPQMKVEEVFEV